MDRQTLASIASRLAGFDMPEMAEAKAEYKDDVKANVDAYSSSQDLSSAMKESLEGLGIIGQAVFEGHLNEKAVKDINDAITAVNLDAQRGMVAINRTIRHLEQSIAISRRRKICR